MGADIYESMIAAIVAAMAIAITTTDLPILAETASAESVSYTHLTLPTSDLV